MRLSSILCSSPVMSALIWSSSAPRQGRQSASRGGWSHAGVQVDGTASLSWQRLQIKRAVAPSS